MKIQKRGTCYLNKKMEMQLGRDVASDSGESNAQPRGDDTTGISACTDAANFVVLFQQFIIRLHLSMTKS
jgi:hypothetical protein